jgi:uncharacterized protein (TIGR02284 family)
MATTPTHLPKSINGPGALPSNVLPVKAMVALCLDRCIAASRNAHAIYGSAALDVRDDRWRPILQERAEQRAAFASELHGVLGSIGAYYKENDRTQKEVTVVPALSRGRRDDVRDFLALCAREDLRALHAYDAAAADLVRMGVPSEIRSVVAAQRDVIFAAQRELERIVGKSAPSGR